MSLFSEIEKGIERGFRRWTERMFGAAESDQLLVLHHAILEEIESQVQTVARGRRVFPYARVTVTLSADQEARRGLLQAAFGDRLGTDVREALEGVGCEIPRGFAVTVHTGESEGRAFAVEYGTESAKQPDPKSSSTGRLVVVKGKADRTEYALERARINIGRLAELTDSEERVVRRNDVIFAEGDDAGSTVSRRHAHIKREDGEYRIVDDGSEFGTRVFRDGRPVDVPAGNRRGERLRPGDEIYLGRACLRFEQ